MKTIPKPNRIESDIDTRVGSLRSIASWPRAWRPKASAP